LNQVNFTLVKRVNREEGKENKPIKIEKQVKKKQKAKIVIYRESK
jgi:hypothetical protein